jgi:hypothetical protein
MRKSDLIPGWIEKELRANFARASRAGRRAARTEPRAAFAEYRSQERALRIELTNGATITLPVELISGLKGARPKDRRGVEVLGRGSGLHWEALDLDLSVPGLISSLVLRIRVARRARPHRRSEFLRRQSSCSTQKRAPGRPSAHPIEQGFHGILTSRHSGITL